MSRRLFLRHLPVYLALIGYVLLLMRSLRGNRCLYWGDILLYFEPMMGLIQDRIRAGILPLWNPAILCGQPLLGNPQMGVFYPATLLLAHASVWGAIRYSEGLHLLLCAIFTYHFALRWYPRGPAAMAAALVYTGSGAILGRLQFPPMIYAAPYLPLTLLCLDRLIDHRSAFAWCGLALAVGLALLAAHPQMTYLALILSTGYALARIVRASRDLVNRDSFNFNTVNFNTVNFNTVNFNTVNFNTVNFNTVNFNTVNQNIAVRAERMQEFYGLIWPALTAGLVGVGLALLQLLPMAQVALESTREHLTASQANRFTLEPSQLLTLIWPHFMGHPMQADYWGPGNAWEPALFIGWVPLILIAHGIRHRHARAEVRFWGGVVVVGIWLALGTGAGLFTVAFYVLPGLSHFHDPARFLIPTTFALAVLTGNGLDVLCEEKRVRTVWLEWGLVILTALPLVYYAPEWLPSAERGVLVHEAAVRHETDFVDRGGGRTYLPVHEVFWRNYITAGYMDFGTPTARNMAAQIDTLMPNLNMTQGHDSASGYEPVPLRRTADMNGLGRTSLLTGEPNFMGLMRLMGVSRVLLPGSVALGYRPPPGFTGSSVSGKKHYRTLNVLDTPSRTCLVWYVPAVKRIEGEMRVMAALAAPAFDPDTTAILSDPPAKDILTDNLTDDMRLGDMRREADFSPDQSMERAQTGADAVRTDPVQRQPARPVQSAPDLMQTPNRITIHAQVQQTPVYLVISSAAFPGWGATVDGRPQTLYRTDGALMGLFLRPGAHVIRLTYAPATFRLGLYLSLCSVMGIVVVSISAILKQGRSGRFRKTRAVEGIDCA